MTVTRHIAQHTPHRLAQAAAPKTAQLVRITEHQAGNRYTARPVAFDALGDTETVGETTLTVVNFAEPADAEGFVPPGTDALAVDAGGRWIVYLPPPASAVFCAKVVASAGGAAYTVREQAATGAGTFEDAEGMAAVTAYNLAELSAGPGAAVDDDTIVLVLAVTDTGSPPTVRFVFDHPVYAKYLD